VVRSFLMCVCLRCVGCVGLFVIVGLMCGCRLMVVLCWR